MVLMILEMCAGPTQSAHMLCFPGISRTSLAVAVTNIVS